VGKIEGSSNAEARVELVARVDAMFLERMCQTHISPRLVYPAVGAVLHLTIDYTATSYSYSTLVNAHFPPQQYERKMVQAPEVRESALHVPSWKEQRNTREQLELKAQSGSIGDWKAYILWERKGKKARTGLVPVPYERATERTASGRWAAIWAEDETQLAGAEAAFRGFWEDFLDSQVGEVRWPWNFELKSLIDWGEGDAA